MVLCYSRLMYVEFTVSQTLEHFLAGLYIPDFSALNPAARVWLDTVANSNRPNRYKITPSVEIPRFTWKRPSLTSRFGNAFSVCGRDSWVNDPDSVPSGCSDSS